MTRIASSERVVLDMFEAIEARDVARLFELYDPDVEFVWPPGLPGYGGEHRGDDVVPMHLAFAAVWDPLQPTPELRRLHPRVIASSDTEVVVHYEQRGIAPDGTAGGTEVVGIYTVHAGRVSRLQMFYLDPDGVSAFLLATAPG